MTTYTKLRLIEHKTTDHFAALTTARANKELDENAQLERETALACQAVCDVLNALIDGPTPSKPASHIEEYAQAEAGSTHIGPDGKPHLTEVWVTIRLPSHAAILVQGWRSDTSAPPVYVENLKYFVTYPLLDTLRVRRFDYALVAASDAWVLDRIMTRRNAMENGDGA